MKKIILQVFILAVSTCGLAQIPTAGLIAYYPFCGNANDQSGNGLNGTVMGATLSADRFGSPNSAYSFNGTSAYISLPPANFVGHNAFSCSMWMRPTSNANPSNIAYNVGEQFGLMCFGVNYNPPGIFTGCYNVGSNPFQSVVNSAPVAINNWVHVVATRDMTNLKLYVNGVLVQQLAGANTNNQAMNYGSPPYAANIGTRSCLMDYFPGQIDDVRIYSTVLTQNDVNALYAEPQFIVGVNSGSICAGNSFTFIPTGAVSYTYPGGSPVVSPLTTTAYTVTGTNASGCNASATATVSVVNTLTISVNSGSVCAGNSFTFIPTGAVSYTYSGGSPVISPTATAVYTVTGANAGGCIASATASISVSTLTVSVNSGSVCSGSSFTLLPSGAVSYTYPGGSPVVSPTAAAVYTVTGANAEGCIASATASISVSSLTLSVSHTTICRGNSHVLSPAGAVSYTYSGGSQVVSPLSNTVYTITGISAAGCTATSTVGITVNPCTGIDPLMGHHQELVIYPNPTTGDFTVSFNTGISQAGWFSLKNLQGKLVTTFRLEAGIKQLSISTAGLSAGCYLGELTLDEKSIFQKKILILDR
jgi:hypothetical protein